MGIEFDWQVTEEDGEERERKFRTRPPWLRWVTRVLLLLIVAVLVGGAWWRIDSAERQLRESIQTVLDVEAQAWENGDGDLFFNAFPNDVAWQMQQLRPMQQLFYAGTPTVTKAEQHEGIVRANVNFVVDGVSRQRVLFFEEIYDPATRLQHRKTDTSFWGTLRQRGYDWGNLVTFDADRQWSEEFDSAVRRALNESGLTPPADFSVIVQDRAGVNFKRAEFVFPSPRLVALNALGEPDALYWEQFESALTAHISTFEESSRQVTLRFALQPDNSTLTSATREAGSRNAKYATLAAQYMANNPGVVIELIDYEDLPTDPVERMAAVDGALTSPSAELIASGALLELNTYVSADSRFSASDYYDQIWQGALWQDRVWMVPFSAQMKVLYYDSNTFRDVGIVEPADPNQFWTFDDMAQHMDAVATQTALNGLLVHSRDIAFAYARTQTDGPLMRGSIINTLDWYQTLPHVTDLTHLGEIERIRAALSEVSSRRQVGIWIEAPGDYEYHLQLGAIGVAPFPASENLVSVAPLWVEGGVVSASSEHPLLVWDWINWVSYHYPEPNRRAIPARPSVARAHDYWQTLPAPLANVMRSAFSTARAVAIDEQTLFTFEQLSAVRNVGETPQQAANRPSLRWFSAAER